MDLLVPFCTECEYGRIAVNGVCVCPPGKKNDPDNHYECIDDEGYSDLMLHLSFDGNLENKQNT